MALNLAWYDWTGLAGTLMVLAAFFLLQAGRVSSTGILIGHYERDGGIRIGDTAMASSSEREVARQERMRREQ